MKTSEVLYAAADEIDVRGWTQGTGGWPGHYRNTGPLCLEGAIMAATGASWADPYFDGDIDCAATAAVREYLAGLGGYCRLFVWNDAIAESAEDVTCVLRAAAVIEAAREEQDAPVEVSA